MPPRIAQPSRQTFFTPEHLKTELRITWNFQNISTSKLWEADYRREALRNKRLHVSTFILELYIEISANIDKNEVTKLANIDKTEVTKLANWNIEKTEVTKLANIDKKEVTKLANIEKQKWQS